MEPTPNTFDTVDILMAAFLLTKNCRMLALRPLQAGKHFVFVFADPERRIGAPGGIKQEFLGDGLAPARTMARNMGRLKACVNQLRSDPSSAEHLRFDQLFPVGRVKKIKMHSGVLLEKSRRVQAIGTEE